MIVTTIPNGKLICQRISTIFHFINMNLPPTDEREMRRKEKEQWSTKCHCSSCRFFRRRAKAFTQCHVK